VTDTRDFRFEIRLAAGDGRISEVIQSPPNELETNSFAMLDFLANLVFYCLTEPGVYDSFTRLAGAGRGSPSDAARSL
jgi:hypothetical protein